MPRFHRPALMVAMLLGSLISAAPGLPLINEILYHPAAPENPLEEYIELHNPTDQAFALGGWRLHGGIAFRFPDVTLEARGFLVVAADTETFAQSHPGVAALGPWEGKLSNSGETIRLSNAEDREVDAVPYADDGDWAMRIRGPDDRGHRGWAWDGSHDGGGASLELVQPALSNRRGLNWAPSEEAGGTPGRANSRLLSDSAPLVFNLHHRPIIPRNTDAVTVHCTVRDEATVLDSVRLVYRTESSGEWQVTPMDAVSEGTFAGRIPPLPDATIVSFYVEADDGMQTRRYPLPEAACLYQVEAAYDPVARWNPDDAPIYRLILREEERAELARIGSIAAEAESNAQMNATFISQDGTGLQLRYLVGVRNRGASSRVGPPNNALVQFRHDDPWQDLASLKFNVRNPHSQALGSVLFRRAGIAVAEALPVRLKINNAVLAENGYAQVESFDSHFAANHFRGDGDGNLYQIRDDEETGQEGDLTDRGDDPDAYGRTYFKQTNAAEDDWSDLISFLRRLNDRELSDSDYLQDLSQVMDIDQWLRALAVDALLGNREGGLTTGKGDDFALYRGTLDTRFVLVPHDLDTLLGVGRTPDFARSIWTYASLEGLGRFFDHPDIERRYLAAHRSLLDTFFREDVLYPLIDQVLTGRVTAATLAAMKDFVRQRRAGVIDQIATTLTAEPLLEKRQGYWWSTRETATLEGSYPAASGGAVLVGGEVLASVDARTGRWSAEGVALQAGVNTILVEVYGERDGSGPFIASTLLEIWYDDPQDPGVAVGGVLTIPLVEDNPAKLRIIARDSYYPGVPMLVRAELVDAKGDYRRDLWDGIVNLESDRPEVQLEPSGIRLYNGVGSALVTIRGPAGGEEQTLVAEGGLWRFRDDGSDQGTAWRDLEFDDSAWKLGRAELGYGDGDEATLVSFGEDAGAKHATTYFRSRFQLEALSDLASLHLHMKYDDAAAVYLNGIEVVRTANLEVGATFADYATDDVTEEDRFAVFPIPLSALRPGANLLAVEIHQGDGGSSDISFDARLLARTALKDAGAFTLTAKTLGLQAATRGLQAEHAVASLAQAPMTAVAGTLSGETTNWAGLIHVTGDLTVPEDHTLTISPGTLILVNGDATPLSPSGVDIDVRGELHAEGTAEQPITFTARDPLAPWGEIHHENGGPSTYRYVHLTRAGHAPRGGHTNTGPAMRIEATVARFENVAVSDIAGKILQAEGSDLTLLDCLFSRAAMGPETRDTGVSITDSTITEMLGIYREDGVTDDNDGIYLHRAGAGSLLAVNGLVVARTDDDGFDTLNADTVLRECILRDCADKGASINGGSSTMERCLFAGNRYGVQAKGDGVRLSIDQATLANNVTSLLLMDAVGSIQVRNSILQAAENEIEGEGALIAYSLSPNLLPGANNVLADPLFVRSTAHDYRVLPGSPARDAADPASTPDPDGSRADIGRFPVLDAVPTTGGTITWHAAQSPIHVREDVVIPPDVTLVIEAGTTVYVSPGRTIAVQGELQAEGRPHERIRFTTDPALPFVADLKPGLPPAPPHWGGIRFIDSLSPNNRIAYADIGYAQDALGAVGIIRSQALLDHCTFRGTHLRMVYAESSSVIVQYCTFPDMFGPDERADALGLDNISEHIKGVGKYPPDGHFIIQHNVFGTNKGHNDVIDVDSGLRPEPILQILQNQFAGAGDELLDLGGDVYIAGNVFTNVYKDDETSDRGYANAISTGDAVNGATIVATRNLFWDVDHAINLKRNVATIFEYNTVYQVHGDFDDRFGNPNVGSVINLYVEEPGATPGDGAFVYGNILMAVPRIFGNVDRPAGRSSALGFAHNWLDAQLGELAVGARNLTVLDLGEGNLRGALPFVAPDSGDFRLTPYTGARAAGPLGEDLGMTVQPGIRIAGEPAAVTSERSATLLLGGPGLFAYRYRLNDGPWSDPFPIGEGFAGEATQRRASLHLSDLDIGQTYVVAAIGQDFAGNWQAEEEATRSRPWRIDPVEGIVQLNEVLAINRSRYPGNGDFPDYVELWNPGTNAVNLAAWTLSDRLDGTPSYHFSQDAELAPDAYLLLPASVLGFALDGAGESLYLRDPAGVLVDTVRFGQQAPDLAVGRLPGGESWGAVAPSPGARNGKQALGDPSGVRISEWLGAGEIRFPRDFVELVNPQALPVDISGWTLTDQIGAGAPFPPLSFLAAQSHSAFDHLRVDRLRDTLFLIDSTGSQRDFVLTDPQLLDQSQRRDGSFSAIPTPGFSDDLDPAEGERLLALLDNLRITEILFHPPGDGAAEFIELQNAGTTVLDLTGVRFTEGVSYTFPERFLQPGEQIVLAADALAFEVRYGSAAPPAGIYAGRLSNGGERLTLTLPLPWEAAILRFDYKDTWQALANGQGYSLVVRETDTVALRQEHPRAWQERAFWTVSQAPGGDPAGRVPIPMPEQPGGYAAWQALHRVGEPTEDLDGDGFSNLEEYGYGTDPQRKDLGNPMGVRFLPGEILFSAAIRDRPDLRVTLESSADLRTWEPLVPLTLPFEAIGIVGEPVGPGFLRLRFALQP